MTDNELPVALREAYDNRLDEETVSDLLLERTVGQLKSRRLLRSSGRGPERRYWVSIATAAMIGFIAGSFMIRPELTNGSTATSPAGLSSTLEEIQRLGSEHARAVEALAGAIDSADATTFRSAQEVIMSATSAVHTASMGFIARGTAARGQARSTDLGRQGDVIWF